ncbi:glycosyltransferase family 1 protein [Novosphingobium sp. MMS21-SN21R]|uniref:glycosyltransferase family 4 protein n=1 Tax=Novosphingobium sp. MMS21-SN21R TaxID=2969298 RepID=UPI002884D1A0|nr:glycosyltransferase family 1 protein [Novosphingobium sp. MMS21-SN21R]MDT0508420.1 glycosyltransferase family 1 protein [Novosphingobium sp. MMS21-SN21R]
MLRKIIINGKFLRAAPTGVHRVATELANALAGLVRDNDPDVAGFDLSLWHPFDGATNATEIAMPRRLIGPMTGIPWEQITLPLTKRKGTLLNLCNIGPVLASDALTMIHDVQVHISPASYSRGFRWWYYLTQPILARRNRLILTVSEFSRGEIARVGLCPAERIAVVHNGVDHVLRYPARHEIIDRLALRGRPFVLGLANTQEHKNIAVLLAAFARPELSDVQLVLFGGANQAAFAQAGLDLPGNVVLAGRVDDGELRALMEHALCLAFPSTTEGFGLPPLEAMLLGCPAIIAPCGALPEVCGDAAMKVGATDVAGWSAAICNLLENPDLRARYAELGRERARQFTWAKAGKQLARAIQSIFPAAAHKPTSK